MSVHVDRRVLGPGGLLGGVRPSRRAAARHRESDLVGVVAASAALSEGEAQRAVATALGELSGRLPLATSRSLAARLPRGPARLVLDAAPTGARFADFDSFVRDVAAGSRLTVPAALAAVVALGRTLQRWLPQALLREVCVEAPSVARVLLPEVWPGVSSDEESLLRTGRVMPLCTGPLLDEPRWLHWDPWRTRQHDVIRRVSWSA